MPEHPLLSRITELMDKREFAHAQTLLQDALTHDKTHSQLHFLLGAIHAENKQYDQAVLAYQAALQATPTLHIARFQLGLLHATLNQQDLAIDTLMPLTTQTQHYLAEFAMAIIAIFKNDIHTAILALQNGLTLNKDNASLNQDMQNMLTRIQQDASRETQEDKGDLTNENTNEEINEETNEQTDNSHLLDIYQLKP
jgi:tetratricopeptide (TPR) repeat protein